MGNGKRMKKHGANTKKKGYKKYFLSTKHRTKDIDQLQDELKKGKKVASDFKQDELDLPGAGQFYCHESDKHFVDAKALEGHMKSKKYKKRLKLLAEKQYTQDEALAGAGITKEAYVPVRNNVKRLEESKKMEEEA